MGANLFKCNSYDYVIAGAGSTGLFLARSLKEIDNTSKILIIEKDIASGLHTSGRNSGVLHAGVYYKKNSLKANICVKGAKRLKSWVKSKNLSINECGKIIVVQDEKLDSQLDILYQRGLANGARPELIDSGQLKKLFPDAQTASGRALWSPLTSVVNPKEVMEELTKELQTLGVQFLFNARVNSIDHNSGVLKITGNKNISFGHFFNCTGIYAIQVANICGLKHPYQAIPFKGIYFELKSDSGIQVPTNLYPVPDLDNPFLGVHFTPSAQLDSRVYVGPTATLALGRENYKNLNGLEPINFFKNLTTISNQYLTNNKKIRGYVNDQSLLHIKYYFIREAKRLIPTISSYNLKHCSKVGIRPQLFNNNSQNLEDDLICTKHFNTTHVLNAISPAFTASFELSDIIIERSMIFS